jgi:hypothetical protein
MNKRTFLLMTLAALVVVFGGVGASLRLTRAEDIVLAVLRRRLGYLNVGRASFEDFAGHYVKRKVDAHRQLELLGVVAPLWSVWTPYDWLPMGHPLRRLEDNVVSNFLQSTDFFENSADESRPIGYKGFFMVGDTRCPNPLARTHYTRGA